MFKKIILSLGILLLVSTNVVFAANKMPADLTPNPNFSNQMYPTDAEVLDAINNAHKYEGIGPISLPVNFSKLTTNQQLLVIVNLERLTRGLDPISGLNAQLNQAAQTGANKGTDPSFPANATFKNYDWNGIEADTPNANALISDYGWLYQDGPGGYNLACTSNVTWGCYLHRKFILEDYRTVKIGNNKYSAIAGDAVASNKYDDMIFAMVPKPTPPLVYTWNQEIPYVNYSLLKNGIINKPYHYQIPAENGVAPYTWKLLTPLSNGFVLSSSGILTGMPTHYGTYPSFKVQITDSFGHVVGTPSLQIDVHSQEYVTAQKEYQTGIPMKFRHEVILVNKAISLGDNSVKVKQLMYSVSDGLMTFTFRMFRHQSRKISFRNLETLASLPNVPIQIKDRVEVVLRKNFPSKKK